MFRRIIDWFHRNDNDDDDYYAGRGGKDAGGPSQGAQEARFRSEHGGPGGFHGPGAFGG